MVFSQHIATVRDLLRRWSPRASAPADAVTVPREEWEAVNEFADMIVPLRDNLAGISWAGKLVDVFAAYDRWYAVRIRADQAPDALRSGEAGKERE